ncbi:MAG: hypothetical protein ACK41Y_12670 [Paracoccus hibiscisoli]|uniref:hypothetical protein n=1 Tax=Paracoccus hibiscisoli TaxID=2023261 RepID=UPI00391D0DDB
MAIDVRAGAKASAKEEEPDDAELSETLETADAFRLALRRENNRFAEGQHSRDLGAVGRLLGGDGAPMSIAFIALLLGLLIFSIAMLLAYNQQESAEYFQKFSVGPLGLATTALGYIFGKKDNK